MGEQDAVHLSERGNGDAVEDVVAVIEEHLGDADEGGVQFIAPEHGGEAGGGGEDNLVFNAISERRGVQVVNGADAGGLIFIGWTHKPSLWPRSPLPPLHGAMRRMSSRISSVGILSLLRVKLRPAALSTSSQDCPNLLTRAFEPYFPKLRYSTEDTVSFPVCFNTAFKSAKSSSDDTL